MLILFGDIRDQSGKLLKIAKNFGRFFAVTNFLGRHCNKVCPFYHPCVAGRRLKKSPVRILPLARKLLSLTRWILGQIF